MTTTNEIADKIAADNGLTKVQAKGIVEAVFPGHRRCRRLRR